ncbi:exosortase [Thalassotalea sp. G2M2-11]|uniref:exosortase n=1 Tax=Thalassotalea sp. G2M2-11 TaxID=2787627 RepID=UPI0019CFCBB6|nr:exosortase [Thalassotalea sp. G2M2-11]
MLITKSHPLLIVLLIFLAAGVSQYPIIENIWQFSFDDGTYSHAYLIPFITGFLYWQLYRDGLLVYQERLRPLFIIMSLTIMLALIIFTIAQFTTGYRISFILFLSSLIALIFRPSIKVLFPSLFLIFLVPIWGVLTTPLQELSTLAVTLIMQVTGIPIFVEENLITIPAGIFEIAGGCSGLRYLLVSLAISSLYTFLYIDKFKPAVLFVVFAILGALLTNWIRITALILIGHYTNMESELMTDHNTFGWYLYIPFMLLLFTFGQKYCQSSGSINIDKPQKRAANWQNLATTTSIVIISSPVIINNTIYQQSNFNLDHCDTVQYVNDLPLPIVVSEHRKCSYRVQSTLKYTYLFNGKKLGQSVNYFENKFTPQNYKVSQIKNTKEWNTMTVRNKNSAYFIEYQFIAGNKATSSLTSLKKIKILNALKGIGDTQLVWHITPLPQ